GRTVGRGWHRRPRRRRSWRSLLVRAAWPHKGREGHDSPPSESRKTRGTRAGIRPRARPESPIDDRDRDPGALSNLLSQTFVVLAWVALWGPAYRLLTAAS